MTDRPDSSTWGSATAAAPPAGGLIGRRLGEFTIVRRLGVGAMAEVYLADQASLKRQVALKILLIERARDPAYVRRFQIEAQAAAALAHGNIVQIYDVGRAEDLHYIAQEYVAGPNLRQLIARKGPADVRLAVAVLRQAAAALQKAAEHGIVHRDIKPENIMLTPDGVVKVADFGLARILGEEQGLNLTRVGVTLGTPLYMSPEQVEGRPLDPRSDIYSLGVTIYHLLAGRPPFTGDSALGVAVQHLQKEPPPLADERPDLPVELCRIVHKMLAKKPADRHGSATELSAEVRSLAPQLAASEEPDPIGFEMPLDRTSWAATQRLDVLMKTSAMPTHRRRLFPWLATAVAIFAFGLAIGWTNREPSLLTTAGNDAAVERKNTAEQQYQDAMIVATFGADPSAQEAAWRAVFEYFSEEDPANTVHVRRAKRQLAVFLLRQSRHDEARPLFDDLAAAETVEDQFRAIGLAGQCACYYYDGNLTRAAQKLIELEPLAKKLDDDYLRPLLIEQIFPRVRDGLPASEAKAWDDRLRAFQDAA